MTLDQCKVLDAYLACCDSRRVIINNNCNKHGKYLTDEVDKCLSTTDIVFKHLTLRHYGVDVTKK